MGSGLGKRGLKLLGFFPGRNLFLGILKFKGPLFEYVCS